MVALVAALLVQASDRTLLTSAMLGTRFAQKSHCVGGMVLALAIGNGVGAFGGSLLAPYLSPPASDLLVALALLSAGISGLWPVTGRTSPARLGAFPATFVTIGLLAIGDRTQFITAALAARSATPVLPAVGAILGAVAINLPAVVLGERWLRRLPLRPVQIVAALLLTLVGTVQALAAIGLI